MVEKTRKTPSRRRTKSESTFSALLRNLYLYSVEYCLFFSPGEGHPVFSKDQIVSILERGYGERKISELAELFPSFATLDELVKKKMLEASTEILVVRDDEPQVLPVSRISGILLEEASEGLPLWWNVPVPLFSCAGGKIAVNGCAQKLFGDISPVQIPHMEGPEFVFEVSPGGGCFLFKEIHPSVFLVEDVSEDMRSAEEMAWWASIGKAFVSKIKGKGKNVRRIEVADSAAMENAGDCLACIWDGKILGYLRVEDGDE